MSAQLELDGSAPAPLVRRWLPNAYQDEVIPPPRATPDAWIQRTPDGRAFLAPLEDFEDATPDEDPAPTWFLEEGALVEFDWTEHFGQAVLRIQPDGSWTVDREMPPSPAGAHMLVRRRFELESYPSLHDLIADVGFDGGREMQLDLEYYAWSDPAATFRFSGGEFQPVAAS